MILRLALKNLKAKPLRALASVAAIAVAVAMFFCIFSFENAVYEYVYAVETADFGESDLMITAKSGGDRLALVEPLYGVDGVENVVPTLSVYALMDVSDGADEYIRLRGFEAGESARHKRRRRRFVAAVGEFGQRRHIALHGGKVRARGRG